MRKRKNNAGEHDEFITEFIKMADFLDNAVCESNLNVRDAIREVNSYQEEIQMNKKGMEELEKQVAEHESEIQKHDEFMKERENEFQLLIEKQKKFGERLSRIVILHKSSEKIKRKINNYQLGIIVVSSCDNNGYIKDVVKPDIIVKPKDVVNFFMRVPYDFEEKYNEKEKESIVKYCNLVINVISHVDDYSRIKLLYCNEDIAKILEMNGIA